MAVRDKNGNILYFQNDEDYNKYKEEEKRNNQTLRFIEVVIAIVIVGIIMCTGSSKDDKQSATPGSETECVQSSSLSDSEEETSDMRRSRTYKKSIKSSNSITSDEIESEPASNSGTGFHLEKVDHTPLSSE